MKNVKRLASFFAMLALAVVLAACGQQGGTATESAAATESDKGYKELAGAEMDKIAEDTKELQKYLVIDVRSPEEYNEGHVKYAINMPIDSFEKDLSLIEDRKEENIVVVCNSGKKSAQAAEILVKNEFKNVFNAEGVKSFKYTTMSKVPSVLGKQLQEVANAGTATIIDAREKKDFDEGHLKGAINIGEKEIEAKMNEVPKDKPVYTYCYSGNRSHVIAKALIEAGYENVFNTVDGTKEYKSYELVK